MARRAVAAAEARRVPDRLLEVRPRAADGLGEVQPAREVGRDGARERAAGPVRARRREARVPEERLGAVGGQEHVDRVRPGPAAAGQAVEVAAFDEDRARAEREDRRGGAARVGERPHVEAGEHGRLVRVRRREVGERQQPRHERGHGVGPQQQVAGRGDHHRVHHDRPEPPPRDPVRDGLDDLGRGEHPRLDRPDGQVRRHGVDLRGHERRRHVVDGRDAARVLGRERRHDAHPEHAVRLKRFQVGLEARAAARVRSGDGESGGERHRGRSLEEGIWRECGLTFAV